MDFQQIAPFFPPFIPPVRLNLHAHSGLLAVMIPGCSPLTNHVLMPTVRMKGGRVGYLEKDQEWVRGSGTISLKVWWCGGEYRYTCWPLTFTSLLRCQTSRLLVLLQWGKILTFIYSKQASSIVAIDHNFFVLTTTSKIMKKRCTTGVYNSTFSVFCFKKPHRKIQQSFMSMQMMLLMQLTPAWTKV